MNRPRTSPQSKKFIAKRRSRTALTAAVSLIAISAVVCLLSLITSISALSISQVQISGIDNDQKVESIHAAVIQALQGKYAGLFSRSNTLIFPRKAIEQTIKQSSPEVESVSVNRDGVRSIAVTVKEKSPAALVCATLPDWNGDDISLDDPGSCYFADPAGLIFKKAPSFSGNAFHRYYVPDMTHATKDEGVDPAVGTYPIITQRFVELEALYSGLKQGGITLDAVLVKGGGEYELYAHNPFAGPNHTSGAGTVVIYLNEGSSFDAQASNLISFWRHMLDTARAKKQPFSFDYIDVRYGANVFYR